MKIFRCPGCAHLVYFESVRCMSCGVRLGFAPDEQTIVALEPATAGEPAEQPTRATLFRARLPSADAAPVPVRLCANYAEHDTCNWTVPAREPEAFCRACRLNAMIPDLQQPGALAAWARLETAKRRLLHTLLALELPFSSYPYNGHSPLRFAFLQELPGGAPVITGHAAGTITINTAEADDAHREMTRAHLGEKYRSLLGHFRHESGHYYWDRLIRDSRWQEEFRTRFGDERVDYASALARHYARGPAADWQDTHVSPYAAAHPWEDWAESWAHYLHLVDTLETARSHDITLRPHPAGGMPGEKLELRSVPLHELSAMIAAWVPLTLALNEFNRGMGLPDLYPFALAPRAIDKIGFVHRVIQALRTSPAPDRISAAADG